MALVSASLKNNGFFFLQSLVEICLIGEKQEKITMYIEVSRHLALTILIPHLTCVKVYLDAQLGNKHTNIFLFLLLSATPRVHRLLL